MKNNKVENVTYRIILAVLSLSLSSVAGTPESQKRLTYEQAYKEAEPRILKTLPSIRSWLDDEHFLLLKEEKEKQRSKLYKINAKTGEMSLFLDYDQIKKNLPAKLLPSQHTAHTKDYDSLIYSHLEDLYQYSVKQNQLQRLTAAAGEEKNPSFSPDEKYLAYTRNHDLYVLDLKSRLEYQLTSDGSETIYNGWSSWVYYEEILGRRTRFRAFWWSPDSRRIAFLRFDDSPVPTFPLFRAKGPHGELEIERYPKSGDPNPKVRLGLVTVPEGTITWADVDEDADHYVAWPFWFADSSKLTFQWMNRDQNHIKIYTVDLETGKKREIFTEKQVSWVEFFEDLHFFKDRSGFLLRSDVDGWSHLYYYDLEGKLKKRLTQGEWSVTGVSLVDEKNKKVYFTARKSQTTENHLFQVKLDGTGFKQLSKKPGTHRILVSPGGEYYVDHYSNVETPSRQDLYQSDGTFLRNIDQSQTPFWNEYPLGKKELFTIPTEDGWRLPAYWILPPDFDESKIYPVLFNIYGGPGASTVWNSYPYLSQLYLAQEGIIIFSVDHRSSGHYGKKGVSLMHRNLGKWEMHDLIEAVKWLRQKPFVDKEKIGISGGSYGGYTTCMALTYGADYFTHGYARASVTDWRLYDTVYTERYMDRPCENEPRYEFGSVMTHAEKLKGVLFLAHGTMDDNVHMQNSVQLIDRFIDLGKKFEFMLYPNQRHGFRDKKRDHSNRHYVDFWFKHFLDR